MQREEQPGEAPPDGAADDRGDSGAELAAWGHPRQSARERVKAAMLTPRSTELPTVDRELARRAIRLGYVAALEPGTGGDWSPALEHALEQEWARMAWPAVRALVRRGWEEGRKNLPDDMSDAAGVRFPPRTAVRRGP